MEAGEGGDQDEKGGRVERGKVRGWAGADGPSHDEDIFFLEESFFEEKIVDSFGVLEDLFCVAFDLLVLVDTVLRVLDTEDVKFEYLVQLFGEVSGTVDIFTIRVKIDEDLGGFRVLEVEAGNVVCGR